MVQRAFPSRWRCWGVRGSDHVATAAYVGTGLAEHQGTVQSSVDTIVAVLR